jgi:uncharacterized repeat protein (TIGR02543 family)/uncharacterized repeat protein (TIGR01451 family)
MKRQRTWEAVLDVLQSAHARHWSAFLLLLVALVLGAGSPGIGDALAGGPSGTLAWDTRGGGTPPPTAIQPQDDGTYRVLVTLRTDVRPDAALSASERGLQRAAIRAAQQSLLARLNASGHRLIAAYEVFPVIALEVDAATLAFLQRAPDVAGVQEDVPMRPADVESNGVVHVAVPWAQGFDGTGWAVAVLDTGVQTNHPFLAGKTIAEACFSTSSNPQKSVSVCPNGHSTSGSSPGQSGPGAGVNCDAATIEGCAHGTHVAGIAVGKNYAGGPGFDGIARGASLIAIQVFSKFTTSQKCGGAPPCVLSYSSDQLAALQYVYTTVRPAFSNIASVNMSLGGGQNTTACDTDSLKPAIDTLRSANIATVIATGNDGYTNAISAPGCISSAISVGATNDVDAIAGFSNRASIMKLFAPGVGINSSVPTNAFDNFDGTSMATPLVAGAWAVVKQKNPSFTVAQTLALLQSTGQPITIEGGAQIPRVRLGDAFGVPTLALNVAKSFDPAAVAYGGTSTLTITLTNPNLAPLTGVTFSDPYPGGMTNGPTPGVANSCGGAVVAAAWDTSLTLSGGSVPANGSCAISVQVAAIGSGALTNTLPVRSVTSANWGENQVPASATLTLPASNFMVQDGGFELGAAATPWTQTSSNFTTPLCSTTSCGGGGAVHSGQWFAWFGGTTKAETGTLTQARTIATGPKKLEFFLWWASAPSATATFKVFMDGTPILSLTGATSGPYNAGWTRVGIDVSSYADGNSHALKFEQTNAAGTGLTNIFLDDIALTPLAPDYTVTFDSNGGSVISSQVVAYGATAAIPTPPTKPGFSFAGWYTDAALTTAFSFATPIKANLTLYAKWGGVTFTVSFDGNGGSAVAPQIVAAGGTATAPTPPTKIGSTFAGWYSDATLLAPYNFSAPVLADITLHAKWTLNPYTVTFNANGGTAVAPQIVAYGNTASTPTPPTRTGSTFGGWYSDANLITLFSFATPIVGDITLYAKWTLNNYAVTFDSNGGSAVAPQIVEYQGLASQPAAPTKTGNTFGGWYSDAGLTSTFSFATPIVGDITLYAKWTLNNYTVTFDANGGSAVAPQIVAYQGFASQPTAPTKTGSTFAGWYSDANLTTPFSFATPVVADLTLHAKWTLNNYTVTFDSNGGSAIAPQVIAYNGTATQPPAPTKAGNAFGGWYADAGLVTSFSFATPIVADLTLYAKWVLNSHTVTFDTNGGSAVAPQVVADGSTATAPAPPTRPGLTFSGWFADPGFVSAFSFATPIVADITLFAKWTVTTVLDIDGDGQYDALTDGLLATRYLAGLTGPALVEGALGADATILVAGDVAGYLDFIKPQLDIDDDGNFDPATDGLLIVRYLFGVRGEALLQDAVGVNAARKTVEDIEAYLAGLMP